MKEQVWTLNSEPQREVLIKKTKINQQVDG
jgi:hypothetical protein